MGVARPTDAVHVASISTSGLRICKAEMRQLVALGQVDRRFIFARATSRVTSDARDDCCDGGGGGGGGGGEQVMVETRLFAIDQHAADERVQATDERDLHVWMTDPTPTGSHALAHSYICCA